MVGNGKAENVVRLFAGALLDDLALVADLVLAFVGLARGLEILGPDVKIFRPRDDRIDVVALAVVLQDFRRQQALGNLPGLLVQHHSGFQLVGRDRGSSHRTDTNQYA